MDTYLSWWQGGLLLAGIAIGFQLLSRKSLGVSGSWARFTFWRETRELYRAQKHYTENSQDVHDEFTRMTLEQFGEQAIADSKTATPHVAAKKNTPQATPWGVHLVFLISILTGALLVSLYDGTFNIQFELSEFHTRLSGQGWQLINTLFIGGLLVGFGTQMAGGCTSGHGLSGCANFSIASFVSIVTVLISASLIAMLVQAITP